MDKINLKLNEQLDQSFIWYYRNKLIWVLALLFVSWVAFKYTIRHKNYKDLEVNTKFNTLLLAMSINDNLTAKMHADEILNYSDRTPYPRLAGILLSKILVMENNLVEANKILDLIIHRRNKNQDEIWHLANVRLAKVLLMQKKFNEAEKIIIDALKLKKFTSKYQELQGDLLVASNKTTEANQFYKQALQSLPEKVISPILDLKIKETSIEQDFLKM